MSVRLPKFGALFEPLVYFTYPIPKIALLPVIMLLAGLGNASKIITITLIIVFQIIIGVRDAVKQISPTMYQVLDVQCVSYGKFGWQTFGHDVTGPASLAGWDYLDWRDQWCGLIFVVFNDQRF